ncbi:Ger(x)C family spore germination protein [Halobacillus karajensis]|nr:Ger(x)C family spore germination protein [Halobacillus karajensis]
MISLVLLSGCMPNQSVEEVAIIQIAGYDLGEDERIRGTVSIPQYGKSEDKASATELYLTVDADSVKDVEKEIKKQSSSPISTGKLAVSLYSREMAEKGLSSIIDVLSRDPRLSRNMYLAVVEGEAGELIKSGYTQEETTSKNVQGLIETNNHHNFPTSSLHDFLYAYYGQGMNPFLPLLKKQETFVELSGIAFFKKGKMVSMIPDSKVFTFKMLKENFSAGMQDLPFREGSIMMDNIGSQVNYKMKGTMDNPSFEINISIKAEVNEMLGLDVTPNPQLANEMEKAFVDYFKKEANELIKMFKEKEIDPLGLGSFAKTRRRDFDLTKWEEHYPELDIDVKVDMEITEYGIFS